MAGQTKVPRLRLIELLCCHAVSIEKSLIPNSASVHGMDQPTIPISLYFSKKRIMTCR